MKKYLVFLICLIVSVVAFGQNVTKNSTVDKGIIPSKFTGIENAAATFEAENSALLMKYIYKNVMYPEKAANCCMEGTEVVQFTITPSGKITNIKVINGICCEINDEVIRVLEGTKGMWKPGYKKGEPIAMEKEVSIQFNFRNYNNSELVKYFTEKANYNFIEGSKNLLEEKKPKKALRNYNKAMIYLPNDKAILYFRGLAKYELGDKEGARQDWDRIKKLAENGRIENSIELTHANFKNLKGYDELTSMFID